MSIGQKRGSRQVGLDHQRRSSNLSIDESAGHDSVVTPEQKRMMPAGVSDISGIDNNPHHKKIATQQTDRLPDVGNYIASNVKEGPRNINKSNDKIKQNCGFSELQSNRDEKTELQARTSNDFYHTMEGPTSKQLREAAEYEDSYGAMVIPSGGGGIGQRDSSNEQSTPNRQKMEVLIH